MIDISHALSVNPEANYQAIATLAYFSCQELDGETTITVGSYMNGREKGFILRDKNTGLAVVVAEHRIADDIVVGFFQTGKLHPTTDDFLSTVDDDNWRNMYTHYDYGDALGAAEAIYNYFNKEYGK